MLKSKHELTAVHQAMILYGHSLIPRIVQMPAGRLVINPGSVGLPYSDYLPVGHMMGNGSPYARYAVISKTDTGWTVEQIAVPYDCNKSARQTHRLGQDEWAAWLETGRA